MKSLETLKQLFKYFIKIDKKSTILGLFFGYIYGFLDTFKIFLNAWLLNSIVRFYTNPSYVSVANLKVMYPLVPFFVIFVTWVLKRYLQYLIDVYEVRFRQNVYFYLFGRDIVRHFNSLNLYELEKAEVYDKVTFINNYWWTRALGIYRRIRDLGSSLLSVVVAFVLIKNVSLVYIILTILLTLPEIFVVYTKTHEYRLMLENMTHYLVKFDYFTGLLTSMRSFLERRVNNIYRFLYRKLSRITHIISNTYKKELESKHKSITSISLIDKVFVFFIKLYIFVVNIVKRVKVGDLLASISYIDSVYSNSYSFLENIIIIFDDLRYVVDLFEFKAIQGFAKYHGNIKLNTGVVPPDIKWENLSFKYPNIKKYLFKDVNMLIRAGEKVLILGKDGSGKSSVIKILTALFPVHKGQYFLNNIDVVKLQRGEVKKNFSVVAEDFGRYYLTLKENITFGDPFKKFDKILYELALDIADLIDWIVEAKIKDSQVLGTYFKNGIEISSGHWQRIAIARSVYRDAPIFVWDQPFTYVDDLSEQVILTKVLDYIEQKHKTFILIGEEIPFAIDRFDKIFVKDGTDLTLVSKSQALKIWG